MTIPLLASGLIDGICAFDVISWSVHQLHAAAVPDLVSLSTANLAHGHGLAADASSTGGLVFAQYFETDVFADTRAWWSDFVSSGKIWTLIFGMVLGYLLRALTSYG